MPLDTPLDRVRATALLLPEVEEQASGDGASFLVAGTPFAEVGPGGELRTLGDGGWQALALAGEPDWPAVDDRVARGWELAAPRRLLEAGGR